jgi:hypothetical protein
MEGRPEGHRFAQDEAGCLTASVRGD